MAVRDSYELPKWKINERELFLERLRSEGKRNLLELGAGTGRDGLFFQEAGLKVIATDLSEEMVKSCSAKGLEAYAMDFLGLGFPAGSFDAAYACNSMLHIPNATLPVVLDRVRAVLAPDALFFMSSYSEDDFEGPLEDDSHDPPRFFSFRSDARLLRMVGPFFEVVDFRNLPTRDWRLQALTLRRPRD